MLKFKTERRRSRMSDRIRELGELLPQSENTENRQDTAAVLKATIDYILDLRKEHDRVGSLEDKLRQAVVEYRTMLLRVKRLEALVKIRNSTQNIANYSKKMDVDEQKTEENLNKSSQNNQELAHAVTPQTCEQTKISPTDAPIALLSSTGDTDLSS